MTISNNKFSEVIQKFMMNEIDSVIKKYAQINPIKLEYVENLISNITEAELKQELLKDFDKTLILSEEIGNNYVDNNIIRMLLWIKNHTNLDIMVSKLIKILDEVNEYGCALVNDSTIIYKKNTDLRDFAKEKLGHMLDDEYYIDKLLTKEELIEYWTQGTSKSEVIRELINGVDVSDLLDLDSQLIFEDEHGEEYLYAEIDC